jgi:hypothetical protein
MCAQKSGVSPRRSVDQRGLQHPQAQHREFLLAVEIPEAMHRAMATGRGRAGATSQGHQRRGRVPGLHTAARHLGGPQPLTVRAVAALPIDAPRVGHQPELHHRLPLAHRPDPPVPRPLPTTPAAAPPATPDRTKPLARPRVDRGAVGAHLYRRRVLHGPGEKPVRRRPGRPSASSTSMTCPNWSTARHRERHPQPAPSTASLPGAGGPDLLIAVSPVPSVAPRSTAAPPPPPPRSTRAWSPPPWSPVTVFAATP